MKKYLPIQIQILSLLFLFSFLCVNRCLAQELDFSAKIDTSKSLFNQKLNITIQVKGGNPEYKVFCTDQMITKGGKIVTYAQKINESTYQFPKITLSNFFICVSDSKEKMLCKSARKLKSE